MPREKQLLDENWRYAHSLRVNQPAEYIAFLKTEARFKGCALDDLPKRAVLFLTPRHRSKSSGSDMR
jgi:hypothetical protein